MRFPATIRFVVPIMLSATLFSLPSLLYAATPRRAELRTVREPARIAGHYTLCVASKYAQQRVDLIIEEGLTGYAGLLLTTGHESMLSDVEIIDETMHATVMTSAGRATLVLTLTDRGVVGTLRLAKLSLAVKGERAS